MRATAVAATPGLLPGVAAGRLLQAGAGPRGGTVEASTDAQDQGDIARTLRGDNEAFTRLVQRHQTSIARLMWRFTRDPSEHEELVQDVFVAAFQDLAGYRGRGPFLNWLRKIAVRTGWAYWRRRRRERVDYREDIAALADRIVRQDPPQEAVDAAETLHALFAHVSDRDRLVLTLLHLEHHSVEEIAELTGWSRSMVKVQAWRARQKLRRMLEPGDET